MLSLMLGPGGYDRSVITLHLPVVCPFGITQKGLRWTSTPGLNGPMKRLASFSLVKYLLITARFDKADCIFDLDEDKLLITLETNPETFSKAGNNKIPVNTIRMNSKCCLPCRNIQWSCNLLCSNAWLRTDKIGQQESKNNKSPVYRYTPDWIPIPTWGERPHNYSKYYNNYYTTFLALNL